MENLITSGGQSGENKRLFFNIWASVVAFNYYRNWNNFW